MSWERTIKRGAMWGTGAGDEKGRKEEREGGGERQKTFFTWGGRKKKSLNI